MPERACAAVFTLYIQNIKLEGVNRTFFGTYISSGVNGLEKNGLVWGLDKILANHTSRQSSPCFIFGAIEMALTVVHNL
jgi:hypothetical protein